MRGKCGHWLGLTLLVCGCGEAAKEAVTVPLDQVPAPVMQEAKKALPDIKFTMARKFTLNGEDVYEVRGKDKRGKIREAEVAASGKLIEIE